MPFQNWFNLDDDDFQPGRTIEEEELEEAREACELIEDMILNGYQQFMETDEEVNGFGAGLEEDDVDGIYSGECSHWRLRDGPANFPVHRSNAFKNKETFT